MWEAPSIGFFDADAVLDQHDGRVGRRDEVLDEFSVVLNVWRYCVAAEKLIALPRLFRAWITRDGNSVSFILSTPCRSVINLIRIIESWRVRRRAIQSDRSSLRRIMVEICC